MAVMAVMAALGPPSAAAVTYADAKFVERTVATGLTKPVAAAWGPDGRLFVVEKHGLVKTLAPNAPEGSTPTTLLDINEKVNEFSDRGLLGVAVDSQFPSQPFLYLAYTAESSPLAPDESTPTFSRLVQVRLNPATGQLANPLNPERVILGAGGVLGSCPAPSNSSDCLPSDGRSHSIGTVRSAPDGTLYLGSGDGAPDNDVNDLAMRALDERSLAGKIVHIDRDGRGLAGHRFCPQETDLTRVCTKLHAKGLRNPFRFHLRPSGGLTVGDVGWNTAEEVDLLDQPGANGGWPCHEATIRTPGYSARTDCQPEYTAPTHRPPDFSYGHPPGVGGAIVGGPEHPGAPYPDGFRGALFYGDYAQGFLKYLERDAGGELVERPFATDWPGTDLELTPRGELAYVDLGDFSSGTGSVKRIAYSSPVARITAEPTNGVAPLRVLFDGRSSTAPDGGTLTYSWEFGDGATSTSAQPEHTYTSGSYTARLTVTAPGGATASETVSISAGNTPPRPRISAPSDGSSYRGGQMVGLSGGAGDDQQGELSGPALQWEVKTIHRGHTHPGATPSGAEAGFTAPDDHDADSHVEITLTATDSGGLSASRTVQMQPRTAPLRLRSSPAGVTVSWAGSDLTTPFEHVTAVGFRTSVSAPATFTSGGRRYDFVSWSDGGARLHPITVPDAGVSLEARYRPQGATTAPPASKPPAATTPQPGDRDGPSLGLSRFDPARGLLAVRATDPSGVARVRLALLRRRDGRCRFFSVRRRGFGRPRSCRRPQLMSARLTGRHWRLTLGRSLPVGSYRLIAHARDQRGNLARRFSGGRRSVRLSVSPRRPR